MLRHGVLVVVSILFSGAAHSQAGSPPVEESPWSGSASLGFLSTSGNTNTTSYNTSFDISYAINKWTHAVNAAANGADESEMVTAEAYQADWKSSYDFREHDYLFGLVAWRKDRFSGVNEQLSESIGYGRRIIDTPAHLLNAEIGAGYLLNNEMGDFAIVFSYTVRHNTDVPLGSEKTDKLKAISLELAF